MHHIVKDWMVDLLVFVDPQASVLEALQTMRRRYIHSILVERTAEFPEYGIVTSTDICDKIIAENRNPAVTRVHEIMASPIITVREDIDLIACVRLMKEKNIHHLPVMNADDQLVGFISATDFMVAAEQLTK